MFFIFIRKYKFFILFLVLLLTIVLIFVVREIQTQKFNERVMLASEFSEIIYQNAIIYGKVDFNEITDFEWDQLLLIRPYMRPREVFEREGLYWQNIRTNIQFHDSITLIVFLYNNQIVAFRDHSRGFGDFIVSENADLLRGYIIYYRNYAVFEAQFEISNRLLLIHTSNE